MVRGRGILVNQALEGRQERLEDGEKISCLVMQKISYLGQK